MNRKTLIRFLATKINLLEESIDRTKNPEKKKPLQIEINELTGSLFLLNNGVDTLKEKFDKLIGYEALNRSPSDLSIELGRLDDFDELGYSASEVVDKLTDLEEYERIGTIGEISECQELVDKGVVTRLEELGGIDDIERISEELNEFYTIDFSAEEIEVKLEKYKVLKAKYKELAVAVANHRLDVIASFKCWFDNFHNKTH